VHFDTSNSAAIFTSTLDCTFHVHYYKFTVTLCMELFARWQLDLREFILSVYGP